jgi:hypothetical protein
MGISRLLPLCLFLVAGVSQAAEPSGFVRTVAEAEVDWTRGTVTAQAGAAADMRMPGPNSARPGAERRARATAEAKLMEACKSMGKILDDKAAKSSTVSRIEYQSDGGVILWLSLQFSELVQAKPAPISLKVAAMPFEVAPWIALAGDGKKVQVGLATYRPSSASPKDAVPVRRNGKGQLELPAGQAKNVDSLAGAAVVIYLEKAPP